MADPLDTIDPPTDATIWAQRRAPRIYEGFNDRGQSVLMGDTDVPGAFTPGELLKIALIGCAGMSSDHAIARRLGEDAPVTISVTGTKHETEDRYTELVETIHVDLSALDDATRQTLNTVVERAIQDHCTVGLTLKAGAGVELNIESTR